MVADPPTRLITNGHSSGSTLTKSRSVSKGERPRSLVRRVTSYGKKSATQRCTRKQSNCLRKADGGAGSLHEEINSANRETLCQT